MARSGLIKQFAKGIIDTEIALKQLKLLLAEFPDERFVSWVDNELTGYDIKDEIPVYRRTVGSLTGSFMNYRTQFKNAGIPLVPNTPKEISEFCNFINLRESIEYSGAVKPPVRRTGNRQSGQTETAFASLLA